MWQGHPSRLLPGNLFTWVQVHYVLAHFSGGTIGYDYFPRSREGTWHSSHQSCPGSWDRQGGFERQALDGRGRANLPVPGLCSLMMKLQGIWRYLRNFLRPGGWGLCPMKAAKPRLRGRPAATQEKGLVLRVALILSCWPSLVQLGIL